MSQQLNFPEKLTFHPKTVDQIFDASHPATPWIKQYREAVNERSLSEMKTLYTETFDFNKKATLHMTFNKFDTQKERGQMLAKLKVLYEMFGLQMVDQELSDYLPLILEFLYAANFDGDKRAQENAHLLVMIVEDGTYPIMTYLKEKQNPYYYLIKGLRETLKQCIEHQSEVSGRD
nr:molecular chaperone TorD family protein [Staphylococcus massiliensis]